MTIKIAHHITICRRMNWFQDAVTDYRKAKVESIKHHGLKMKKKCIPVAPIDPWQDG